MVIRLRLVSPHEALNAAFARNKRVVQGHEVTRDRVVVGRNLFGENGETRIAVRTLQITENLIVGLILLHDVDDVFDMFS